MSRAGGPFGSPILTLHASVDAACESVRLDWRGGHVVLRYWARSLSGNAPQVCMWESPVDRCATISSSSSSTTSRRSGWIRYSSVVTPSQGTHVLSLFLYAYSLGNGTQSVDQYANVQAFSVPSTTPPLLTGIPKADQQPHLVVGANGFSSSVTSTPGVTHVLVDGLRNGWVGDRKVTKPSSSSSFFTVHNDLYTILSFAGLMAALAGIFAWVLGEKRSARMKVQEG